MASVAFTLHYVWLFAKFPDVLKDPGDVQHVYDHSPVWIRICGICITYLDLNSRSPVLLRICLWYCGILNTSLHSSQFFLMVVRQCGCGYVTLDNQSGGIRHRTLRTWMAVHQSGRACSSLNFLLAKYWHHMLHICTDFTDVDDHLNKYTFVWRSTSRRTRYQNN